MRLATIADLSQSQEIVDDLLDRATLVSQFYDDFVESDEGDGHLRAPGIHASELKCERQMAYSVKGTEGKRAIKKTWRQRFEVGKAVHLMIQRDFHKMAEKSQGMMQFESEVVISPKLQGIAKELRLQSSCDGIISYRQDPFGPTILRIGLEIKTEAPDGYEKLKEPKPDHVEQGHLYMRALDLPMMYFMYINKGNQNNTPSIHPYLVVYKPEIWAAIEAKCRRVLQMVADNEEPARKEGLHCTFCAYAHVCQPAFTASKNTGGAARWKQPRSS